MSFECSLQIGATTCSDLYAGVAGWTELQLADGTVKAIDAVANLARDRFRAMLSVLGKVTVAPVGEGGHVFKDERMQVKWL
jgi:hypothetical protein